MARAGKGRQTGGIRPGNITHFRNDTPYSPLSSPHLLNYAPLIIIYIKVTSNPETEYARRIIEYTDTHLFLTGKAGTGKTTFLRRLKEESAKRMVVLAPTGIAAINAGGTTIHSFFQLPFAPFIPGANYSKEQFKMGKNKLKLIRSLDLLVIDEISMVRADLLDSIDAALRRYRGNGRPFGGVQLLMIGDLLQLAPVVTENEQALLAAHYDTCFFFSSHALRQTSYLTIELKQVYRQNDPAFIDILNKVREGRADAGTLQLLNARYRPQFSPRPEEGYIRLVTHNYQAAQINHRELAELPGETYTFKATTEGTFPESSYPTDGVLELKKDAQIMFVKNDVEGRYYNGMIGKVTAIGPQGFSVQPLEKSQEDISLSPEEWTNARYVLNEKTGEIEETVDGIFRQYPVKLAWAITIHKSQGLTFERAIIDAHQSFAHGQTYVALSRLKTLDGLVLSSCVPPSAIITDTAVSQYSEDMAANHPDEARLNQLCADFALRTLSSLFEFGQLQQQTERVIRVLHEFYVRLFPDTAESWLQAQHQFKKEVADISQRFLVQLRNLMAGNADIGKNEKLQERVKKGATYFMEHLSPLAILATKLNLPTDNAVGRKRLKTAAEELNEALGLRLALLRHIEQHGFSLAALQEAKAQAYAGKSAARQTPAGGKTTRKERERVVVPAEIEQPELYQKLVDWRYAKAKSEQRPAYVVLQQKALHGIANLMPDSIERLKLIPYIGKRTAELYGKDILKIVAAYLEVHNLRSKEIQTEKVPVASASEHVDTAEASLHLFRKGLSIDEIAAQRQLTPATIFSHIARHVLDGTVELNALVDAGKVARIKTYFSQNGALQNGRSLGEIRKTIGEDIGYGEIKLVETLLKKQADI